MKIFVLGLRGFPNVQGGVEKHCEWLYPRLVKLGCEVTVIARSPYVPRQKRVREWNGVKFIYIWCPREKNLEAPFHTFIGCLICIFKRPDIVHFHNAGKALFIPLLKFFKIKTVFTFHNVDYVRQKWGSFAKLVLKVGEFIGIKFADRVIVISEYFRKFVERNYNKKEGLVMIPYGIDLVENILPAEDVLKKYNIESQKYIFTASRFVPEKGLHDLIEAYNRIKDPEFKLVIAGDADHETKYSRNLKKVAQKNKNIVLTGFASGNTLQALYSNAGLFVLPSYDEGFSIALLEAMSYGLPVLVSDIPENKEIDLPEFRYFPVGNVEILARKIKELFYAGISQEEKQKIKEILRQNHNWDKVAEQTFNVFKTVLES